MTYGWSELLKSGLGTLTLPCFFLAPGYLVSSLTNVFEFKKQSWIERLLWSLVLSVPVSLILAVHPGAGLSPLWTLRLFEVLFLIAMARVVWDIRHGSVAGHAPWDRYATICAVAAAGLVAYCLLAAAPLQIHQKLYESAAWQDWNVRIQLVNSALRGGSPPGNPMFAVDGVAPPLHYYYFWYVLCAQICLLTGVGARAALTTSAAGAALALMACVFLSLKYLGVSRHNLRRQCAAALLVGCVLGLDILPAILGVVLPFRRVHPDIQLWLDDRSPSWLHLILWSPHHVGGLVCCVIGTLLVLRTKDVSGWQRAVYALLAAVCFAAAAGTSTFVTALFVLICVAVVVDAAWRREWAVVQTMIGAGVLSLLIAMPFLHSTTASQGQSHARGAERAIKISLRYNDQAHQVLMRYFPAKGTAQDSGHGHRHAIPLRAQQMTRPVLILTLFLADFGFFLFVLGDRVRRDFFSPGRMERNQRVLWLMFLGVAVPGFLVSSSPAQLNNDLGRHAGMCMRFVLLLWASPLVATYLEQFGQAPLHSSRRKILLQRCAVAAFGLGLAGQVWQIAVNRFDIPLVEAGEAPPYTIATRMPNIGWRFHQIQLAMEAAAQASAPNAIVQANPNGRLEPVYLLYTGRQMAASDDGCNAPFGGDPSACPPIAQSLVGLFGGTGPRFHGMSNFLPQMPLQPELITTANFDRVCHEDRLSIVVATYSDLAWRHPESWVWQRQPVYANSTSRVFACPIP